MGDFKIMADALLTNALVLRSDSKLHDPMTANLNLSMLALGDGTLWPSIQDLDFKIMADELLTNALAIRPSLKVPYNNSLLNLAWPSLNDKEHCSYGKTKRKTTYNSTTTSTVPFFANRTRVVRSKNVAPLRLSMLSRASWFRGDSVGLMYDPPGLRVYDGYAKSWNWTSWTNSFRVIVPRSPETQRRSIRCVDVQDATIG